MRAGRRKRLWMRLGGGVVLVSLLGGVALWWNLSNWQPNRAQYPLQGMEISAQDGLVNWQAVKAIKTDFVYLHASASAFGRDPQFVRNLEEARSVKLPVGAVHAYDPCQPADKQAANFVTIVPRDGELLPPAVELKRLGDDCPMPVNEAAIQSELTTFLNQVETHTGTSVVLKVSKDFEERYQVAAVIDRTLWLESIYFEPDYGQRPWALWTANPMLRTQALPNSVRWIVARP